MAEPLKVLIVEDHPHMRRSLKRLFDTSDEITVVGEACDGRQGVDLCSKLKPDVVLLDVGMPVMDGIEACRMMRLNDTDAKIIMLTSHDNERDIFASLAAGANGYCVKGTDFTHLLKIVQSVAAGELWLDSAIAGKVLRVLPTADSKLVSKSQSKERDAVYEELSKREIEVLELIVEGLSNADIAQRMGIGRETVKTHIKGILNKLAVSDRTQAAIKALRSGLV